MTISPLSPTRSLLLLGIWAVTVVRPVWAEDWPTWGRTPARNMSAPATGLPDWFDPGKRKEGSEEIDPTTTKNVKWVFKLGSQSFGNPTVAQGKIFVGTNNEIPRDPKHQGDRGIVMCLDEKTGKFLWQLAVPKLGAGKVSDWEYLGICSSPTADGDRVYVVTNRCEVLCLDAEGLANGNDGPFKDEGQYMAGPGKPPVEPGPTDADILWLFDMRDELGVFPHNITSSSVLLVEDRLYVTTSNGVDWSHLNIPNPRAPALIALDKRTGKLVGEEGSGISGRLYHGSWSSPTRGTIGDKGLVIFGAGDGFCYGLEPDPVPGPDGFAILKERWRYDCNLPAYKRAKYATAEGPSEVIATPAFDQNRVYVAIGQDPEHGEGMGNLVCIDATKQGDITEGGTIWSYDKINRSISTVSIAEGLLYVGDYAGNIHCLDADTGEVYWVHPTEAHIWSSTMVADGKVYVGTEDGDVWILTAGKERQVLNRINLGAPVYSSPIVANGVLYVASQTHLYAIQESGQ